MPFTDREVQQLVIDLVRRTREKYGIGDNCAGTTACRAIGLTLRRDDLGEERDGLLTEENEIVINTRVTWRPRVEFTIFHEITHYLLEDEDDQIIEHYTDMLRHQVDGVFTDAIEHCCHWGAAEFLMPWDRVKERIATRGFSIDTIRELAASSGASFVAAAIQAADWAPVECYIVICSYGYTPMRWAVPQTLFAETVAMKPGMGYPLARYSEIPEDHLFHQAWILKTHVRGQTFIPYPSGKRYHCEGEAILLHERVIGILYPKGRPVDPSTQLSLMIG